VERSPGTRRSSKPTRVAFLSIARGAILLFDVLHLMRPEEQEELLAAMAERLEPGGVVLVREADASAGWRSTAVRLGNRLKAIAVGSWRQEFQANGGRVARVLLRAMGSRPKCVRWGATPFATCCFV
jgi:hypothetical protein